MNKPAHWKLRRHDWRFSYAAQVHGMKLGSSHWKCDKCGHHRQVKWDGEKPYTPPDYDPMREDCLMIAKRVLED